MTAEMYTGLLYLNPAKRKTRIIAVVISELYGLITLAVEM